MKIEIHEIFSKLKFLLPNLGWFDLNKNTRKPDSDQAHHRKRKSESKPKTDLDRAHPSLATCPSII